MGGRRVQVRACHTRNPYLVPGEIMIVPRANFPVGQPATPIHRLNTECERVLMLPLLEPGNLSLFVITAGRVSWRFAFRSPSRAYTLFLFPSFSLSLSRSRCCLLSNSDRAVRDRRRGPLREVRERPREKSIDIAVHTSQWRPARG